MQYIFFSLFFMLSILASPYSFAQQGNSADFPQKDSTATDSRYLYIKHTNNPYYIDLKNIDTSLSNFYKYSPANNYYPHTPFFTIGNIGQATQSIHFELPYTLGFSTGLMQYYKPYLFNNEQVSYFFSSYPFTDFTYNVGTAEQQLAQFRIGIKLHKRLQSFSHYRRITSPGVYAQQKTGYHNFYTTLVYQSKKQRYQALGYFIRNTAYLSQSGGTSLDSLFINPDQTPSRPQFITPYLFKTRVLYKEGAAQVVQSYNVTGAYVTQALNDTVTVKSFVASSRIGHRLRYTADNYTYISREPSAVFYEHLFANSGGVLPEPTLYDITQKSQTLENELFLVKYGKVFYSPADSIELKKWYAADSLKKALQQDGVSLPDDEEDLGGLIPKATSKVRYPTPLPLYNYAAKIYAKHAYNTIKYPYNYTLKTNNDTISNTVSIDTAVWVTTKKMQSVVLGGELQSLNTAHRFGYYAQAQMAVAGFNAGNINAEARLQYAFKNAGILELKAHYQLLTLPFVFKRWYGANLNWHTAQLPNFEALQLGAGWVLPVIKVHLFANQYFMPTFAFFNEQYVPQFAHNLTVWQAGGEHTFNFSKQKHWYLYNKIVFQAQNGTNALNLPTLYGTHHLYYKSNLFKKAMYVQAGAEVQWNTNYSANGFMPATAQFFVQNTEKQSYYPVLNLYFEAKIKRLRFFASMQHVNQGIGVAKGYFAAFEYPATPRTFMIGVNWAFYD